ncbi:MAG: phosphotransferase [Bacteroidetes bacterium]|nr:phosphotransferase [Bacteroidota bacterium]
MQKEISAGIQNLYQAYTGKLPEAIEKLAPGGGDREYYRVFGDDKTYIATFNENIKENSTFIKFAKHFHEKEIPVPRILATDISGKIYLQEDLGDTSLLNALEKEGFSEHVFLLYEKTVQYLARMQVKGDEGLDYNDCITAKEFGKQAILNDLLYCKYYFIDTLKIPYDKQALLDDFEHFSTSLTKNVEEYFMFRDFQSRNVMVKDETIFFIDFQGGMKGPLQYDMASLLWQAKAALPTDWKNKLLEIYLREVEKFTDKKINHKDFHFQFNGFVLIRLIQVLGAYGFRGLFERKAHFLSSIPFALKNLKLFLEKNNITNEFPAFNEILRIITSDKIIEKFEHPVAGPTSNLLIEISSFSYKNGIPEDTSGNGGGYVFDCRGILNPGRIEQYKTLTGKDKPVILYLELETRMPDFLNSIFDIIDIHVEDYLTRGFTHLAICFGCTGGQHRSVYAAEQMNRHLRNKYKVNTLLRHLNKSAWVTEKNHQ